MQLVIGEYKKINNTVHLVIGILTNKNMEIVLTSQYIKGFRIINLAKNKFNRQVLIYDSEVFDGRYLNLSIRVQSPYKDESCTGNLVPTFDVKTIYMASCDVDWGNTERNFGRFNSVKGPNVMWDTIEKQKDQANLIIHHGDQIYADDILEDINEYVVSLDSHVKEKKITQKMRDLLVEKLTFDEYCDLYTRHWSKNKTLACGSNIFIPDDHDFVDGFKTFGYEREDLKCQMAGAMAAFKEFQMGARIDPEMKNSNASYAQSFNKVNILYVDSRTSIDKDGVYIDNKHLNQLKNYMSEFKHHKNLLVIQPRTVNVRPIFVKLGGSFYSDIRDDVLSSSNEKSTLKLFDLIKEYKNKNPMVSICTVGGDVHEASVGYISHNGKFLCTNVITSGVSNVPTAQAGWSERMLKWFTSKFSRKFSFGNGYKSTCLYRNTNNNIGQIKIGEGWKYNLFCNGKLDSPTFSMFMYI